MTHRILILAFVLAGASSLGAQGPITGAKRAARNAAAATNQHTAQETGQQVPQQPAPAAASQKAGAQQPTAQQPAAQQPSSPPSAEKPAVQQSSGPVAPKDSAGAAAVQQGAPADSTVVAAADSAAAGKPLIMRESFEYGRDGRRDPFVSLMKSRDLRPTMSDLRLTGVLFDMSGRRPIAILRDSVAGVQWRVTTGMSLGRMRIAAIRPKTVVFTIEEFGFSRQDSLVLGDTTRVRSK